MSTKVQIKGCGLFVTRSKQQLTSKYYGNRGPTQSNCQERSQNFSDLTNSQSISSIFTSVLIENDKKIENYAKLQKNPNFYQAETILIEIFKNIPAMVKIKNR